MDYRKCYDGPHMAITKEDIMHLGTLSRIKLNDEEVSRLQSEVSDIIGYVSTVSSIVAESDLTKQVGAVYNVFREDEVEEKVTNPDELIEAFPEKSDRYLKVKKIL